MEWPPASPPPVTHTLYRLSQEYTPHSPAHQRPTSPLHLPCNTTTCPLTLFPAYYLTFHPASETLHSATLPTSPSNIRPTPTSTLHLLFTISPPLQNVHMPFPILHHLLPKHTTHPRSPHTPQTKTNTHLTLRYAHLPFHLPLYTSTTHTTWTDVSA